MADALATEGQTLNINYEDTNENLPTICLKGNEISNYKVRKMNTKICMKFLEPELEKRKIKGSNE